MTQQMLDRSGAVPGVGIDAGVASHYGDPLVEQRRLYAEGGAVDRSHRGVVAVTGVDRLGWLHSLTSQHLEHLQPGVPTEALVLSPHGHVEHHLVLRDDGTTTWITTEPGLAQPLTAYLDAMRFMLRVEVSDVTAEWAQISVVREGVSEDMLVPRGDLAQRLDDFAVPVVGHDAWEARRVELRVPRLRFETDHRTIPHEVGWIGPAVHLDKGCYRGQETVARVHNLGRPPRRLVFGHLDGTSDVLPQPHADVELDGRTVGFLGTAVHHAELGPVALAVVKRNTPDDAQVTVAGMAMSIERVVDA